MALVPPPWDGSATVSDLLQAESMVSGGRYIIVFSVDRLRLHDPRPFEYSPTLELGAPGMPVVAYVSSGSGGGGGGGIGSGGGSNTDDRSLIIAVDLLVSVTRYVSGVIISGPEGVLLLRLDQRIRNALIEGDMNTSRSISDAFRAHLASWRSFPIDTTRSMLCTMLKGIGFKCKSVTTATINRQGGISTMGSGVGVGGVSVGSGGGVSVGGNSRWQQNQSLPPPLPQQPQLPTNPYANSGVDDEDGDDVNSYDEGDDTGEVVSNTTSAGRDDGEELVDWLKQFGVEIGADWAPFLVSMLRAVGSPPADQDLTTWCSHVIAHNYGSIDTTLAQQLVHIMFLFFSFRNGSVSY